MTRGNFATGRGKSRSFSTWCGELARSGGGRPVRAIVLIQAPNLASVTRLAAPDQIVIGIAVQVATILPPR
ncbi:hypothetical protein HYALB_00007677 [Hymenoscyphus albidus]|uniref:Uncharacterized protein n=1 Tax=Hymenoscyphus albidus TaxID=595503 RepID=A0A9N9LE49_9HELO|nr:hypothetical protein HYALB_00007677 [Hymenoscyphus albidus]